MFSKEQPTQFDPMAYLVYKIANIEALANAMEKRALAAEAKVKELEAEKAEGVEQ